MWLMAEDKALDGYAAEGVGRKEEELSLFCSQITLDPVWELLDEVTVNRVRNEIRLFSLPPPKTVLLILVNSFTNRRLGHCRARISLSGSGKGFCRLGVRSSHSGQEGLWRPSCYGCIMSEGNEKTEAQRR